MLNLTQDKLTSAGAAGIDIMWGDAQLSKLKAGNNIIIGRNFPDEQITISTDGGMGNLYTDPIIQSTTALSNLIKPSLTGSNKIRFPFDGNFNKYETE